ncbi:cytochrome c biogenesis protein ResB [candidate division KSB1 bacterium]|nr:cytochrome c biogenesis protein ResB [candidate division KSB1 bacterium]
MNHSPEKSVFSQIYSLLSSVKLALGIVITLGLFSLLAIFLGEYFPSNFPNWEQMYTQKLGGFEFQALKFLGIFDPYHSFWYQFLLGLLVLNIAVCTYRRTRGILKIMLQPGFQDSAETLKNLSQHANISTSLSSAAVIEKVRAVLHQHHFKLFEQATAATSQIYATKGGYARIGFILFHLGLIAVVIGGLIISLFGYSDYLWGSIGSMLSLKQADFTLRVDDFKIETNAKGEIRDYLSTLTVLENGQAVKQKMVEVNYPLRHKGFTFYQSSYRQAPNQVKVAQLKVTQTEPTSRDTVVALKFQEKVALPGYGCQLYVMAFVPDFRIDQDSVYSASMEARNPALQVLLEAPAQPPRVYWLFQKFPQFHQPQMGSISLQFLDFEPELFTGLQVSRKPGHELIWAGIILMTVGLLLTFYIFHRRLWMVVESTGATQVQVLLGGNINKNQESFKLEFKALADQIKLTLK